MPTFQKPNLEASRGDSRDAFISVRSNRRTLGISAPAREALEAEAGDYVHFALDTTYRPWIGITEEPTGQGEPTIHYGDPGYDISSTLLCRQLSKLLDGEPDGVIRFPLSNESELDEETGIVMHRLEVPDLR
jgi:hypothetical protein